MRLYGGPRDSSSLDLPISEFKPQNARAGGSVLAAVPAGVSGPCRSLPAGGGACRPVPARTLRPSPAPVTSARAERRGTEDSAAPVFPLGEAGTWLRLP